MGLNDADVEFFQLHDPAVSVDVELMELESTVRINNGDIFSENVLRPR